MAKKVDSRVILLPTTLGKGGKNLLLPPKEIAHLVAQTALDKKANQVVILDMIDLTNFTDFFVICSGNTDVHVRAIAEAIIEVLEREGVRIDHQEGLQAGQWALLDLSSIVVHIFHQHLRDFYQLEQLWADAKISIIS